MSIPATIREYMEAIDGDEKFVVTCGAGVVNALLLVFGYIDMGTYATILSLSVGAFIAGDVIGGRRNATVA